MVYPFECETCGERTLEERKAAFCNQPAFCPNDGWRMKRTFSHLAGVGLVPHKAAYSDDWNPGFPTGARGGKDLLEYHRAAEARNEKTWQSSQEPDRVDIALGATPV